MSEPVTKSVPQEQQEQRIKTRTAVKRIGGFTIVATAVAVLAVFGVVALYAQSQDKGKYSLVSLGAELRSPTSGDTRTGLTSPPPEPPKYSR